MNLSAAGKVKGSDIGSALENKRCCVVSPPHRRQGVIWIRPGEKRADCASAQTAGFKVHNIVRGEQGNASFLKVSEEATHIRMFCLTACEMHSSENPEIMSLMSGQQAEDCSLLILRKENRVTFSEVSLFENSDAPLPLSHCESKQTVRGPVDR